MEAKETNQELGQDHESGEKLFTQDEVNSIVQKRVAREKDASNEDLEERERLLLERELKADCREALSESGLSIEFLDLFNGETKEDVDTFVKRVKEITDSVKGAGDNRYIPHIPEAGSSVTKDPVKDAFKPPNVF